MQRGLSRVDSLLWVSYLDESDDGDGAEEDASHALCHAEVAAEQEHWNKDELSLRKH